MGRTRLRVVVGALVVGFAWSAMAIKPKAPPRPEAPNEKPTAWACSVETLVKEKKCFLEAEVAKSPTPEKQARSNVQQIAALADRACRAVAVISGDAIPDKVLFPSCQKEFVATASLCTLDGKVPILDARGRFAPEGRECYRSLATVLRKTRMVGSIAGPCCKCLEKVCKEGAKKCQREAMMFDLGASSKQCLEKGFCRSECFAVTPFNRKADVFDDDPGSDVRSDDVKWY